MWIRSQENGLYNVEAVLPPRPVYKDGDYIQK